MTTAQMFLMPDGEHDDRLRVNSSCHFFPSSSSDTKLCRKKPRLLLASSCSIFASLTSIPITACSPPLFYFYLILDDPLYVLLDQQTCVEMFKRSSEPSREISKLRCSAPPYRRRSELLAKNSCRMCVASTDKAIPGYSIDYWRSQY